MEKDSEAGNEVKPEEIKVLSSSMSQTIKIKPANPQNSDFLKADFIHLDVDSIEIEIIKVDK